MHQRYADFRLFQTFSLPSKLGSNKDDIVKKVHLTFSRSIAPNSTRKQRCKNVQNSAPREKVIEYVTK